MFRKLREKSGLQTNYWQANEDYILRNAEFDTKLGVKAWSQILSGSLGDITSVVDVGANIGRNIGFLQDSNLLPNASYTAIDINEQALRQLNSNFPNTKTIQSSIQTLDCGDTFDLVFTSGVLIHISPDNLHQVFDKLIKLTSKYCILIEYFNRTPIELSYQGRSKLLWKRDFGRDFLNYSGFELCSYGFLWGYEYDQAGFDDTTYWVFRR